LGALHKNRETFNPVVIVSNSTGQFEAPFNPVQSVVDVINGELLGCMGCREMGKMLHNHCLTSFEIADSNGQIAYFRFNTVKRGLKAFHML
jgi:hypothetical protein